MSTPRHTSTTRGFARAAGVLQSRIRAVSEGRGFAVSRLLTHWPEVVGEEIAALCRPVEVKYGRGGLGATLTLLTTGAQAPMLEMRKAEILERVNACYGYRAVQRLRLTQTAATGFAEGQAVFQPKPKPAAHTPRPETLATAETLASGAQSDELRRALTRLATNYLSRQTD